LTVVNDPHDSPCFQESYETMKKAFERFYDDFKLNEQINHQVSKTLSTGEHQLFSLLTLNHHPIHINADYARQSNFGRVLVNGTYVFSVVVGLTVPELSFNAIANLGYEKIVHHAPVFEGDTLVATTRVLSKRQSKSRPNAGIVEFQTQGAVGGKVVISFKRSILIPLTDA
jgi:acyl dehydratase